MDVSAAISREASNRLTLSPPLLLVVRCSSERGSHEEASSHATADAAAGTTSQFAAISLGGRIYGEKPKKFTKRLGKHWNAWREREPVAA